MGRAAAGKAAVTDALTVVTFWWGQKYGREYVDRLAAGLRRNLLHRHYRLIVIAEQRGNRDISHLPSWEIPGADRPLLAIPGCFARLRLFDPIWLARHGVAPGTPIVCLDLDLVVTGPLDALFAGAAPFTILHGANAANPCPFNGSVWMLRAGEHPEVWADFSLDAAARIPRHEFADDQGWFAHKMPQAATWPAGPKSGIYAFRKPGWPKGDALPPGARIVAFPGARDPRQFVHLPWVRQHWIGP